MILMLQVKEEPPFILPEQCTIELASQPSPAKIDTKIETKKKKQPKVE